MKTDKSMNGKEVKYTVMSAHRRSRTPLSQVFAPSPDQHWKEPVNGHSDSQDRPEQVYELTMVTISKTKQSLGEFCRDVVFDFIWYFFLQTS